VTQPAPPTREWFWRILAGLMLAMACWVGWVAYQIVPVPLVTPAAYHALTQAQASRNVQEGIIRPAAQPEPAPLVVARKAPIDAEKLRLAESIETPIQAK
jgi:hypothetical protein